MNLPWLKDGLLALSDLSVFGWLAVLVLVFWVNRRAGLPRARRDLQLRGAGLLLLVGAGVLDVGRGLVAAWPWPPQGALLGAALAPWLATWLFRRGHPGLAVLAGLSFPFLLLITFTAFFGLWLNLALIGGSLLALALAFTLGGAVLTWRTPRPAQPLFGAFGGLGRGPGGLAGGFQFGGRKFHSGGTRPPNDDIVDIDARTVDEPPPALPRRDDGQPPRA